MILLDMDILSLILAENPAVVARLRQVEEVVANTVITRVEILRGRHEFLLKVCSGSLRAPEGRHHRAWGVSPRIRLAVHPVPAPPAARGRGWGGDGAKKGRLELRVR
jgi:hypothetical protein